VICFGVQVMQDVRDKAAIIVDFVLRRCTDAWTIHDYSSGGSDCIEFCSAC
jgi:hypothetical protein